MTTTAQAFSQFLTDISATQNQQSSFIPSRKDAVAANLTTAFGSSLDMPFSAAYLMGSASKNTIVRPLDDIDVLAVFRDQGAFQSYRYDSASLLYRVRKAYDGLQTQRVGARGQAVRVFFQTGGFVDVAPVFATGWGPYWLPSGDGSWITTSPFTANKWFMDRNASLSYNLAPLVRMLKKWNRAHSKRLQSFHLETMTANMFTSLGTNYREALGQFFDNAARFIECQDPGQQSGSLSGYLDYQARRDVTTSFTAAKTRIDVAMAAEAVGNHDEAKRLWKIVLGTSFPA